MADALLGGIVINEVLPDPNSALSGTGPRYDTDGSGTVTPTDEFIEIMNTSGSPIDIGGLQLWDQTLGNWYAFPAGTILQPGGHAMVMVGPSGGPGPSLGPNDMAFYAGRGSAVLNNGPENVILRDPASNTFVQIAYGGAPIVTPGGPGAFPTFPAGATRIGAGEDFGTFIPGQSIQRTPDGGNIFNNGGTPTPGNTNICFAGGTLIETPLGRRAVEAVCVGDLVLTVDGRAEPVLWVGHRKVTAAELADNPVLWPVTIKAGALGSGVPTRTLRLSRHHRVRVDGRIAERMGGASLLVPAHALLDLEGVTCSPEASGITWHHILLPGHAVLLAEGAPAESLYLGRELTKALSSGAIEELAQIFPNRPWVSGSAPRAHPFLSPSKARKLVARHIRHNRPLVSLRAA